ncbi:MAG: ABC transporter permease [Saprospiraceae bacterium]
MQQSIIAEWYKIKNTPIIWLVILAGIITSIIVSAVYMINVIGVVELDVNPWESFLNISFAANSIFIMLPFMILMITYICHLEIQSNGWKFLYTLPIKRAEIYLSKLFVIVLLFLIALGIYFFVAIASAYLVDFLYPEFEFRYYTPNLREFLENIFKLFLSLLGVIGFQYWLSLQSKNFILPIGIGLVGFIIGFLIFASNSHYGQYFPFSFPMFIKKFKIVKDSGGSADTWYQVSGTISVLVFLGFTILGVFQNRKKDIK